MHKINTCWFIGLRPPHPMTFTNKVYKSYVATCRHATWFLKQWIKDCISAFVIHEQNEILFGNDCEALCKKFENITNYVLHVWKDFQIAFMYIIYMIYIDHIYWYICISIVQFKMLPKSFFKMLVIRKNHFISLLITYINLFVIGFYSTLLNWRYNDISSDFNLRVFQIFFQESFFNYILNEIFV